MSAAAGPPGPTAARVRPAARMLSSLSIRNYRLYFWGYSVSVAGTWMQTLALGLLVLRLTGSGTDLGVATAARFLPFVVLGPFGGLIADRYDKRRVLYVTQAASAVIAVLFALLTGLRAIKSARRRAVPAARRADGLRQPGPAEPHRGTGPARAARPTPSP